MRWSTIATVALGLTSLLVVNATAQNYTVVERYVPGGAKIINIIPTTPDTGIKRDADTGCRYVVEQIDGKLIKHFLSCPSRVEIHINED